MVLRNIGIRKMENIEKKLERCKRGYDPLSRRFDYSVYTSSHTRHTMSYEDAKYCLLNGKCWEHRPAGSRVKGEALSSVKTPVGELYEPGTTATPEERRAMLGEDKPGVSSSVGLAVVVVVVAIGAIVAMILGKGK